MSLPPIRRTQSAARSMSSRRRLVVYSILKIGEGLSAKAFRITMSYGRSVAAKIPHTEDRGGVRSEVASLQFAWEVLGLNVPRVLAWSAEGEGVGAEYVIMEETEGRKLCDV
jgi:aminoglycoside phosphotransferase